METERLAQEVHIELGLIEELITSHELLIKKVDQDPPDAIEKSACAALLHSFYNGIEKIFVQIGKRVDGKLPSTPYWHQELINAMAQKTGNRDHVISPELQEKLIPYLGFRHFFRHAYTFQFKWEKMRGLIAELNEVYTDFKKEICIFVDSISGPCDGN